MGQGFELVVGVIAGTTAEDRSAAINGARTWTIGTEVKTDHHEQSARLWRRKTCSSSGFAWCRRARDARNPRGPGTDQGPFGSKSAEELSIQPVPLQGRPAEFLGGVGRFELHAEASPKVVRVGQELDFRIKVTGPAAWGMTDRPDLARTVARTWPADRAKTG